MSYQFSTARTVLGPAIFLLSLLPVAGQNDSNKDRMASENTDSAVRRQRAQSASRDVQAKPAVKLPFEQSVVIYYKVRGKTSATINSSNPPVVMPPTDTAVKKGEDPQKELTDAVPSAARQGMLRLPRRANTSANLEPRIIYYRAYGPAAAAKGPELQLVESNLKPPPASVIKNEAAANPSPTTGPKQETHVIRSSNTVPSGPDRIAERPKPTDENETVGEEISPPSAKAKLNETLAAVPKPLPGPIANSIEPPNSDESLNVNDGQSQPSESAIKKSETLSEGIRLNNQGTQIRFWL